MIKINTTERKKYRIRNKLKKFAKQDRFRLTISRSNTNISAQIIDDQNSITILTSSSKEKSIKNMGVKNKTKLSEVVAKNLAQKAVEKKNNKNLF